jgi:hypothetical protein
MSAARSGQVAIATLDDVPAWLVLAAEVEPLFGPMVGDPQFHAALERTIGRGTAFCVREEDRPPGVPLLGGPLFSATRAPVYRIGWLAVAARAWRLGVGRRLAEYVLGGSIDACFGTKPDMGLY